MDKLDVPKKQQTALDNLKDFMFPKSIAVIEHDDLFVGDATFADEADLAMFLYKKENKKIVGHDDFDYNITTHIQKCVF